ncbi:MAG TPA: hypothetical protein VGK13_00045 [Methanocellaceae archaeon]
MAKGKSTGKQAPKKTNWSKIAVSLFLAITMIIVIFAYAYKGAPPSVSTPDRTLTLVKSFDKISDGLKLVPENGSYVRYANLTGDATLNAWMNQNFHNSMPNSSAFEAPIQRDMLSVYPRDNFGNFSATYNRNFSQQYVSLTDFGRGEINVTYPVVNQQIDGQTLLYVNDLYYFTPLTDPVVNGMAEVVVPTLDTMTGATNNTSYVQYKGLMDQLAPNGMSEDGMTLQVVGNQPVENFSDMYYAGIGPNNDANKSYTFQAVMRLNRTLTNSDMGYFSVLPDAMKQQGYTSYNISYGNAEPGDYVVVKGVASFDQCVNDMFYTWGFMRY